MKNTVIYLLFLFSITISAEMTIEQRMKFYKVANEAQARILVHTLVELRNELIKNKEFKSLAFTDLKIKSGLSLVERVYKSNNPEEVETMLLALVGSLGLHNSNEEFKYCSKLITKEISRNDLLGFCSRE